MAAARVGRGRGGFGARGKRRMDVDLFVFNDALEGPENTFSKRTHSLEENTFSGRLQVKPERTHSEVQPEHVTLSGEARRS